MALNPKTRLPAQGQLVHIAYGQSIWRAGSETETNGKTGLGLTRALALDGNKEYQRFVFR